MRKVILHYHLFKNAGSSVDGLLKKSFGDKWLPFDPTNPAGKVTGENLGLIIDNNPEILAFSSHCIVPPLPEGDYEVFPMVVLRDPIARVMSAYSFEWRKQLGLDKAKGTLSDYVRDKFSKPRANAIEDFQTIRLSVSEKTRTAPRMNLPDEVILSQAKEFISSLPAFGLVEEFGTSLSLFKKYLGPSFPEMHFDNEAKNVTKNIEQPIHERHSEIREKIGTDLFDELVKRNQLDIKLHAYAQGRFHELKKQLISSESNSNAQEVTVSDGSAENANDASAEETPELNN